MTRVSRRSNMPWCSWRFLPWSLRWARFGTKRALAGSSTSLASLSPTTPGTASESGCSRISFPIELGGQRGQSTVEAAVMLPLLMLLFALLVQPVCVLHTRMIMRHAAAETARVLMTSEDEGTSRSFALRRLRAVPEASLFHVGGSEDWVIHMDRSADGRHCEVSISGHARPLPFFGVVMRALGTVDGQGLLLEETIREQMRPSWLGGDYESWMEAW